MNIRSDLTELIGHTPMVYLDRYAGDVGGRLAAKLELFNPFSIKDRPVRYMLEGARQEGLIDSDTTIVEATSGNTGMALAFLCKLQGYKLILCMSEIQSEERKRILAALGARLELTPAAKGTLGSKERALELCERIDNSYYIEQHANPHNARAHQETTGPEIWEDTDGQVDLFVAGLGTTGTLMGVARAIKPKKPDLQIVGVEPETAAMILRGEFTPHRQAGVSPGFIPKLLDRSLLDEIVTVTEEDSFASCRELAEMEGLFCGITSGMTAWAARELARRPENEGKLIVPMFADTGQRYLSVEGLY